MSDQTFCPSKPHLHISSNFPSKFWPIPLFLTIAISNVLTPSWKSHFFNRDATLSTCAQTMQYNNHMHRTVQFIDAWGGGCMQFKGWCHPYDAHNPDTQYIAMVFVSQRKVAGCWDLVWMAGWAIIIPPYSTCNTCIWRIYCTRKNSHLRMADPAAA